ncbi:hypothetical protein KAW65_06570 [candidate division WOR-3 bacterium]|nr:hypothetical protein [candidate division WOR-3 bacterium]
MKRLLGIIFVFFLSISLFAQEEPKEEAKEIKGKFKGRIIEKKPYIKLSFNPFEAAASYMKKGEYIYDNQLIVNSNIASSPFPTFSSEQLVKPWLHGIVRDYIALFHPMYGYDVLSWKLFITDEKGNLFKLHASKGPPPKNIYWNGRGDDGKMMNPGITYFYSAEATDSLGNISRLVGRTLIVKGILYKEAGEWLITLKGDRVWESEGSTKITEQGEQLLQETADIIKQLYTRKLTVQVYSRNEELSNNRADIIANWLFTKIIVPKSSIIHISGFTDEVYKSSYIKIIL